MLPAWIKFKCLNNMVYISLVSKFLLPFFTITKLLPPCSWIRRAKTYSASFSQIDLWFLLKFSSFTLSKGRQTPLLYSESVKVTKNVVGFYFRMWNLVVDFPSGIKFYLSIQFSHIGLVLSKIVSKLNCSRNSKSSSVMYFFFEFGKLHFQVSLYFLLNCVYLIFQLSFGYVSFFRRLYFNKNNNNYNKTARIRAKPWMFRLPFKVYGAAVMTLKK